MRATIAVLGILVLSVASVVTVGVPPARAPASSVLDWWWSPEIPIHPENVTLYARLASGTVPLFVIGSYCYVPPSLCLSIPMEYRSAEDVWVNTPSSDPNKSPNTVEGFHGASYAVAIKESGTPPQNTTKKFVPFITTLNITATLPSQTLTSGESTSFEIAALYNGNASLPVRTSATTVAIDDIVTHVGFTDALGQLTYVFDAPSTPGPHTLRVTVTNGTLTESEERPFNVVLAPVPDFQVLSATLTSPSPKEGDSVLLTAVVKNIGNAPGTGTVTLFVDDTSIHTATVTLDPDEQEEVTTTWIATGGSHSISARVSSPSDENAPNDAASTSMMIAHGPPYLVAGVGIGIAAIALLGAAMFLRKRRKAT